MWDDSQLSSSNSERKKKESPVALSVPVSQARYKCAGADDVHRGGSSRSIIQRRFLSHNLPILKPLRPPFPPPPPADYLPLLVHVESQKHATCSSGSCVFSRPFCPCHCCAPPSPSGQRAALHCFFVLVLFISLGCKEPSFLFGVCGGDIFCSTRVHVYHLFAGLALWPPF